MSTSTSIKLLTRETKSSWQEAMKLVLQRECGSAAEFIQHGILPPEMPYTDDSYCLTQLDQIRQLAGLGPNDQVPYTITVGPVVFIDQNEVSHPRHLVPSAILKICQEFEQRFIQDCRKASAILMENISESVKDELKVNPKFQVWIEKGRPDLAWQEIDRKLSLDPAGSRTGTQANLQIMSELINLHNTKQKNRTLAEYLRVRGDIYNNLKNMAFDRATHDNSIAMSFLIGLSDDYSAEIRLLARSGEINSTLTLVKAHAYAAQWECEMRRMDKVRPERKGSMPGSTTAGSTFTRHGPGAAPLDGTMSKNALKRQKKAAAAKASQAQGKMAASATPRESPGYTSKFVPGEKKKRCSVCGFGKGHDTEGCPLLKDNPDIRRALAQSAAERKTHYESKGKA